MNLEMLILLYLIFLVIIIIIIIVCWSLFIAGNLGTFEINLCKSIYDQVFICFIPYIYNNTIFP